MKFEKWLRNFILLDMWKMEDPIMHVRSRARVSPYQRFTVLKDVIRSSLSLLPHGKKSRLLLYLITDENQREKVTMAR
jgi:hypothetical protein